jgi:hypothetical protein
MNRTLHRVLVLTLGTACWTLAGCDCQLEDVDTVIETFEGCGNIPLCGWTATQADAARITTTFHDAEHGLELRPGVAASMATSVRTEEIHVVSDCRSGIILHVDGRPFRMVATSQGSQPYYRLAVVVSSGGDEIREIGFENQSGRTCVIDDVRTIDDVCIEDEI